MKRYVWYFLLFNLIIALINTSMRADIDCMDNSFHLNRACGPDLKRYHHVQCNCPCGKYLRSFIRGRCEQCLHYRAPRPLEVVRYNSGYLPPQCTAQEECNTTPCCTQ